MASGKVIYQLSKIGDDELGDGSLQRPVATMDRALDLYRSGDTIAREGVLVATAAPARDSWRLVGVVIVVLTAVLVGSLIWQHPSSAFGFGALTIVCWIVIAREPRQRRRDRHTA